MFNYRSARGIATVALVFGAVLSAMPAASATPGSERADNWYVLVNREAQTQVLDDRRSQGNEVMTYTRHDRWNQQWDFTDVPGHEGYFTIRSRQNPGNCLQQNPNKDNEAVLRRCTVPVSTAQQWAKVGIPNTAWFRLQLRDSGRCIQYKADNSLVELSPDCTSNRRFSWLQVTPSS